MPSQFSAGWVVDTLMFGTQHILRLSNPSVPQSNLCPNNSFVASLLNLEPFRAFLNSALVLQSSNSKIIPELKRLKHLPNHLQTSLVPLRHKVFKATGVNVNSGEQFDVGEFATLLFQGMESELTPISRTDLQSLTTEKVTETISCSNELCNSDAEVKTLVEPALLKVPLTINLYQGLLDTYFCEKEPLERRCSYCPCEVAWKDRELSSLPPILIVQYMRFELKSGQVVKLSAPIHTPLKLEVQSDSTYDLSSAIFLPGNHCQCDISI